MLKVVQAVLLWLVSEACQTSKSALVLAPFPLDKKIDGFNSPHAG